MEKTVMLPVTHDELVHLISDTISYLYRLRDTECTAPEYGYTTRLALLEKLRRFDRENFPQPACVG